eukprot:gene24646-31014_t
MSLLILLIGAVSFKSLSLREYPKIDEPTVTVTTRYVGASAEVVESQVTKPLEDSIAGIDAVDVITSISRAEQSQITVRFRLEKDADTAAAEVRDRTSRVRNRLPQAIEEPVIAKVEADAFPVIWLAFSSDTLNPLQINDLVNRVVKPRLQTVTGVADVRIFGERKYAMLVSLDHARLSSYKLTPQDVEDAIRRSNLELPAGRIESSNREFSVSSQTDLTRPGQFGDIVIRNANGFSVKLRDVAQIKEDAANDRSMVRLNGQPAISAGVIRQATANPLELSAGVREMIPRLKADLPGDMEINVANDNSVFIDRSIKNVFQTIRWLTALSTGYENLLRLILTRARWVVVLVMIGSGVGIAWIYPTMKQELAPLEDRGTILATVNAPDGSTLEYTDRYARSLEKFGQAYPEFDRIFANMGNPTVGQGTVVYRAVDWDERQRTTLEIARELGGKFNSLPGVNAFPITPPSLGQGFRERPLNFVIQTSDSYQNLNLITRQMMDEIAKNPGILSPDVDLRLNKPELRVEVDRVKAAELGVSIEVVAKTIETMLGGRVVTRYKRDAEQYDVIVQTLPSARNTPDDIDVIQVRGRNDAMIPLSSLVKVRESVSPRELNHFGQRRSVSITANLAPDYSLGEALKFMDETAAKVLKPGYTTELNGTSREFKSSQGALVIVFVLALFFIFLVLAAQFESFIDPFVIMLSVPLSMIGALLALKFTGGSLNVYSQIGLITLVGLITKHGILIVEFTNQLREQGLATQEALIKASGQRLRPILMTTGAMVLGAVPLALATGAGAESRTQIGWVIVGGMSLGTLLAIFVVPTMYSLLARKAVPGPNKAVAHEAPLESAVH